MDIYNKHKRKWKNAHEKEGLFSWGNLDELTPGKFLVRNSEFGPSGKCDPSVETTGVFDTAKDALAFIRFTQIPRILSWITGHSEEIYKDAEIYLPDLDKEDQIKVQTLLENIDIAIKVDGVTPDDLEKIQTEYNGFFDDTNPESQILAWGSLHDLLRSGHFVDAFIVDKEEEVKSSITLSELVCSGEFDENNSDHLVLAVEFLKKHEVC